jgi:hypothetical protein
MNLTRTFDEIRMHKQKDPDNMDWNLMVIAKGSLIVVFVVGVALLYWRILEVLTP